MILSNLFDSAYLLALIASAATGIWYFLAPARRAKKQSQWRKQEGMTAIAEWGEWLLGFVIALVFIGASIGLLSRYFLQ